MHLPRNTNALDFIDTNLLGNAFQGFNGSIFPLFAGFEFLSLELWNNFEQTGYYRRWGEANLFIIHAMSLGTPLTRLMRLVLDLLFFFCFGFLLPCCEAWLILLN